MVSKLGGDFDVETVAERIEPDLARQAGGIGHRNHIGKRCEHVLFILVRSGQRGCVSNIDMTRAARADAAAGAFGSEPLVTEDFHERGMPIAFQCVGAAVAINHINSCHLTHSLSLA